MKFLLSSILALAATGVHGQAATNNPNPNIGSSTDLENAWKMDEPIIAFTPTSNVFVLTYNTTSAGSSFDSNLHINEDFYDKNCKDDDGNGEYRIGSGIYAPNTTDFPQATQNSNNGYITLEFEIVPEILNKPGNLYQDNSGIGQLDFCVRTTIGYGGENDGTKSLAEQLTYGYKEVNFIESLVTVTYNLTAGFATVDASVKPKIRQGVTEAEDVYGLQAWICELDSNVVDYITETFEEDSRQYPGNRNGPAFEQGSLIPVCIRPDYTAFTEGVVMRHINDFKWERTVVVYDDVEQIAIKGPAGATADNRLTYHDPTTCNGYHYCTFQSVLFADFYVIAGNVDGSGSATVKYAGSARRLGQVEDRKLQEEGSPFDVSVPLAADESGPGSLKTAGGVSLGLTALASVVALASAGLMA